MAILPRAFPWLFTAALAAQDAATLLPSQVALRWNAEPMAQRRAMELPELLVDEPGDGSVWARGRGYKAQIAPTGLQFLAARGAAEALAVDFATVAVRIGERPLPQAAPTLTYRSGSCQLDHGSFVENFALRPEGVEQSWVFASLPQRGELTIDVAWASTLPCLPDRDGHCFRAEDGSAVRYGQATAIDAAGKRLAVRTQRVEDRLRIVVPQGFVAAAQLPLVVDPLVGPAVAVAASSSVQIDQPDLAFDESTDRWLLVWNQQFSGSDWDVHARRLDRNLSANGAAFGLELTSAIWRRPRVANLRAAAQFLVVAQNGTSSGTIVGRRVPATGAALAPQVLDADVNCSRPDVGGDPYGGSVGQARYNVVWSRSSVVQSVTVSPSGVLGAQRALTAPGFCGQAAISKGNREQRWLVAFVSISSGFEHVRVARINWNGDVIQDGGNDSTFVANLTGTSPNIVVAVSSPNVDGRFLVAWHDNGDIWVRATEYAPVWLSPVHNLQVLEGSGASSAVVTRQPSVDTDGLRFAVAYAENVGAVGSGNDDVFVSTLSLTNTGLRVDEARVGVAVVSGFSDDTPRVSSPFASREARWTTLEDHGIAYAYSSLGASLTEGIEVRGYDGYASTGGFTTFASACGSPVTLTASGVPALGRTVTFDVAPGSATAGFVFGMPDVIQLAPICSCILGVDGAILLGTTLPVSIPANVSLVGEIVSCQGFSSVSGPCYGSVSLSDTIDMRIR